VILCEKYARFLRVVVQRLGEEQTAVRVIFRRGEAVEVWRMKDYSQDRCWRNTSSVPTRG
jgi:hypothetical protein